MIDTCQANTLYKHFNSPNIIATGSSEIDQSSYSHHADNDVGVAVIDRWTYYVLDYLESQVTSPTSKRTLGNLFDSYDESKIHSRPGVRWDLFPGAEQMGRERLIMDFFGNVQGVEVEEGNETNETEWRQQMKRLEEIIEKAKSRNKLMDARNGNVTAEKAVFQKREFKSRFEGPAKVEVRDGWTQPLLGAATLLGCVFIWGGASWLES